MVEEAQTLNLNVLKYIYIYIQGDGHSSRGLPFGDGLIIVSDTSSAGGLRETDYRLRPQSGRVYEDQVQQQQIPDQLQIQADQHRRPLLCCGRDSLHWQLPVPLVSDGDGLVVMLMPMELVRSPNRW